MTFRVGQKVVCIEDNFQNPSYGVPQTLPKKGDVYTIRCVEIGTCGDYGEEQLGLRFCELIFPPTSCGHEFSFAARCFRPIVERKTSIEIFQRMLKPSKVEDPA